MEGIEDQVQMLGDEMDSFADFTMDSGSSVCSRTESTTMHSMHQDMQDESFVLRHLNDELYLAQQAPLSHS